MRAAFPRFTTRPVPIDMTPLVDVVLTLVLFFMLTSTFIMPFGVSVDVPEVSHASAEPVSGAVFEVQILKSDRLVLGGRTVSLEEFRREIGAVARVGRPVLITGDRGATLGRTLEVWDACKGAGVKDLHIRTEWGDAASPKSESRNPK